MNGFLLLTTLVLLYLFAIGYLGYRGYRGTKTATDYLIAGREIHPFVMAMSYGAAKSGAVAGAVTGFAASAFWLLFIKGKEAESLLLSDFFFGRPHLLGNARTGFILWSEVDPVVVALPLSIVVTVAVSMMTKRADEDHLNRCFGSTRRRAPGPTPRNGG